MRRNQKSEAVEKVRLLGVARLGIGAAFFVAPSLLTRLWLGRSDTTTGPTRATARSLGAREVALGIGTLTALDNGKPARGWVEAGVLADAADAVNALFFMKGTPPLWRLVWTVVPAAIALYGADLADRLD